MADVLSNLRNIGYRPTAIVDGGANIGEWAKLARTINPGVTIHLIEPLPNCVARLLEIAKLDGNMFVHPVAVTTSGISEVRMNLTGNDGLATSAQVALAGEMLPDEIVVQASTMDQILHEKLSHGALLKLDLQGHEINAMKGATRVLEKIEVLIAETNFYQINDNQRPIFSELFAFISERGFELYDIATLTGRQGDNRLQWGDLVFVRKDSKLAANRAWRL
jgi:FkbM family methyltransferase